MTLHWPQITYLVCVLLVLGVELAKDGEPKTGNYNFALGVVGTVFGLVLLYCGGFFG